MILRQADPQFGKQTAPVLSQQQFPFGAGVRVAQFDPHQKPVEL